MNMYRVSNRSGYFIALHHTINGLHTEKGRDLFKNCNTGKRLSSAHTVR